jgi:phosphate-selective porin OprO/OprP
VTVNFKRGAALVAVLLVAVAGRAAAAPSDSASPAEIGTKQRSSVTRLFDRIWSYATLYESPESAVLQKVAVTGRFQVDFPVFDSNRGSYDDPQVRRFRIGAKSRWLSDFVLHGEADIDFDCDRGEDCDDSEYEGLTEAYLGWDRYDAFRLKVGKVSAPFTLDGATSSKRLLTLERNNVTQNLWFPVEYHAGASADGHVDAWGYRVGAFSSSSKDEFGTFDGGYFLLFSFEYDLSTRMQVPEFLLSVDYVYNEEDEDNVATRDLSHVLSLRARFDTGTWGVRADLSGGLGYGSQHDLLGLALVPFYNVSRTVQLVARYTHLHSSGNDGIRFSRYDDRIDPDRGGQYDEFFAGLNWFIYGHDFKLQTGVKYTVMSDRGIGRGEYRGWGWTTGMRMAW